MAYSGRMGSDGHCKKGIEGVDTGCGFRRVGVREGMKYY